MSSSLCIRQVLISVANKSKILNFAQSLSQQGSKILSTEGTAKILTHSGLLVHKISDYTKLPEIMNGRLKTLHHKIYAGILGRKNLDQSIMNQHNIQPIDMVVINFYPFHETILRQPKLSQEKILEYIDIGGPNIVRAAAKNYAHIVVIIDYNDYEDIIHEMHKNHGSISLRTRFNLATKAFQYITEYDLTISNYFHNQLQKYSNQSIKNHDTQSSYHSFPKNLVYMNHKFIKKQNMRYGENPHQRAALYIESSTTSTNKTYGTVATAQQLQGKILSYNNIIDIDTAWECVNTFNKPTCVIVKHATPCGVSTSDTIESAYNKAYQADPISAFGGIIAINYPLNKNIAQSIIMNQHFIEAIIAPSIHTDSLNFFSNKKNIRILSAGTWQSQKNLNTSFKQIRGGLLIQDDDNISINLNNLETVTISKPTSIEIQDALFCWKIVKFVKSNAIVCGKNSQTTGIGTGQMNRVDAVKMATSSFKISNTPNKIIGSVMASDAFFTFSDGIDIAAKMGIRCIIQPGGSIQDPKIIQTANQYGISMIFTHIRHFRH